MTGRGLRGPAALLAASTAWGAAVSVREGLVGEPLGWRAPGSVVQHLAVGWGSAVSAPWPMVALVLGDALGEGRGHRAGRWCRLVGAAVFAGTAVEPATWGRRARSPPTASAVVANLVAGALLIRAGGQARTAWSS